jgi:EgtB-related family protein
MTLEPLHWREAEPDGAVPAAAWLARCGDARALAQALQASRADTLETFARFERALPGLQVPKQPQLNLPLWELGHIGWFQSRWTICNPQWHHGRRADPDAPLLGGQPGVRIDADGLYDSSAVPHACRWSLSLPDADTTRAELETQLAAVIALLESIAGSGAGSQGRNSAEPAQVKGEGGGGATVARDDALYFFRLALLHEDMHHEAALYMAQGLGVEVDDPRWQPAPMPEPPPPVRLRAATWRLGSPAHAGFAFDNELSAYDVSLGDFEIDAQALRWAEFLPGVEAGACSSPAHLRRDGCGRWQRRRHGRWDTLDLREAACHLTLDQALAWCAWAGRRLPTEAEWERAACTCPDTFRWGDVWEWTASPFAPYPGFEPHPYRDYSAPWFDGRPVLRGASYMTQPRMRHPRYRNFFPGHRSDVPAGLRTCAR